MERNVSTQHQDIRGRGRVGGGGQIKSGEGVGGAILLDNSNGNSDDDDGGSGMLVGLDET